jgi:hypothetical protein
MLPSSMVESNHEEERLARIEQMIETLQRESAALKVAIGTLATVVEVCAHAPELVPLRRTTWRRFTPLLHRSRSTWRSAASSWSLAERPPLIVRRAATNATLAFPARLT